jgi:lipoprotein-releasing system permease protein
MKLNVNTEIALTYLSTRKKQTLVATLGVMFGISMFIFMQSLMKGTNDYFEKMSFTNTPHIRIYSENKVADKHMLTSFLTDSSVKVLTNPKQLKQTLGLTNPYGLIQQILKNREIDAVTPQVTANVLYTSGSVQLPGNVAGVNITEEDRMFDVQGNMVTGDFRALNKINNSILIGKGIADKLSLHVGDNITVRSGTGSPMVLRVVGTFATNRKANRRNQILRQYHPGAKPAGQRQELCHRYKNKPEKLQQRPAGGARSGDHNRLQSRRLGAGQ